MTGKYPIGPFVKHASELVNVARAKNFVLIFMVLEIKLICC